MLRLGTRVAAVVEEGAEMGYFRRESSVSIGSARFQENSCEDWGVLTGRDAIGDLGADARAALAAHAARCPRCARRAEREARLTRLLCSIPLPAWPDDVPLLPPAAIAVAAPSARADAGAFAPARPHAAAPLTARGPRRAHASGTFARLAAPLAACAALAAVVAWLVLGARGAKLAPPSTPDRRIDLVSPASGTLSAWRVATICAALDPPLASESVRLLVNDRDVTSASECTPDFILFTSEEPLPPGEHLVALEVRGAGDNRIQEKLWIVTSEPTNDAEMTP